MSTVDQLFITRARGTLMLLAIALLLLGTCNSSLAQPRRISTLGNGLFYDFSHDSVMDIGDYFVGMIDKQEDGQHPISVNAYVGAGSVHAVDYAAVWLQDDDSAFPHTASLNIDRPTLDALVITQAAQGFRPVSIGGYREGGGSSRFTVSWIRDGYAHPWTVVRDLDVNDYQLAFDDLAGDGWRPISVSGYNTPGGSPRFAAIFVDDNINGSWITSHAIPIDDYQTWVETQWDLGMRPISLSGYRWNGQTFLTSVMVEDTSGSQWIARHGIEAADIDGLSAAYADPAHVDNPTGEVYRPVGLAAYEYAGSKRYAGIWKTAAPRRLTISGAARPGMELFDDAVTQRMMLRDLNAVTLTIADREGIKLARAYTWAPEGFARTEPEHLFRFGSVSKAFSATTLVQMIAEGIVWPAKGGGMIPVTLDTPVFNLVGMPDPAPSYNSPVLTVTIRQLLRHRAGWCERQSHCPNATPYFVSGDDANVASALGQPLPVQRQDIMTYMFNSQYWPAPVESTVGYGAFFPGTNFSYANFHYSLVAQLIELFSGISYESAVKQRVFDPLGAYSPRVGNTARLLTEPQEPTYSSNAAYFTDVVPSGTDPIVSSVLGGAEPVPSRTPDPYGRFNIESIDATGSWTATSRDVACFLMSFNDYNPNIATTDTALLAHNDVQALWSSVSTQGKLDSPAYAHGWQVTGSEYHHSGSVAGARGFMTHEPMGRSGVNYAFAVTRDRNSGIRGAVDGILDGFDFPAGTLAAYDCPMPTDLDGDGIDNRRDNCTLSPNPDQRDTNGDGFGNVCDADLNNDLVVNASDLGLLRLVFFTADPDADFNGDGVVNSQDLGTLKASFFEAPGPSGIVQ